MKHEVIRSRLRALVPGFARTVAPIYELYKWEWAPGNVRFVPSESDIVKELYRLVRAMVLDGEGSGGLSTGGLKVFSMAPNEGDECWNIGLEFKLSHVAIIGDGGETVFTSVLIGGKK